MCKSTILKVLTVILTLSVCIFAFGCDCGSTPHEHQLSKQVVAPTCEVNGYTLFTCNCGYTETASEVQAIGHDYGDWVSIGVGTHAKICENDNSHKIIEDCSGGTATCSVKAVCSTCFGEYGELGEHISSSSWSYDSTHHYKEVLCGCDVKKDYGEHTFDNSGYCTVCGCISGLTEGLQYRLNYDGSEAEVYGYYGSSKTVNIMPYYEGVPVVRVYSNTFKNNTNITTVVLPETMKYLDYSAFYGCTSLNKIELPEGVEKISTYAFFRCSAIEEINLPNSLKEISTYAFQHCTSLRTIVLPEKLEVLSEYAFSDCSSLESVTFDNSQLLFIQRFTFANCSKLENLTIKENSKITTIQDSAFYNCTQIKDITLSEGITSLGNNFATCHESAYTTVNGIKYLKANSNPYYVLMKVTNTSQSSYTIQQGTAIIAKSAFSGLTNFNSIVIPNSVLVISEEAFKDCRNLTTVEFSQGSKLKYSGSISFQNCERINKVKYNGDINDWIKIDFEGGYSNPVFYAQNLYINNQIVTKVNVTKGTKIGSFVFAGCKSITSVTVADNVQLETIGAGAFNYCTNLKNVYLGKNCKVKTFNPSTFSSCVNLEVLTVPKTLESVGYNVFNEDNYLKVFYEGNFDDWDRISIVSTGNSNFNYGYRYYYVEDRADLPSDGGNYWHYVNGVPTIW